MEKKYRHTYKDLPRDYKIETIDWTNNRRLKHCLGYCDDKSKTLFLNENVPKWVLEAIQHMTIMHELVHARLSKNGSINDNDNEVELEAICRANKYKLLPAEKMLRCYLTKKSKLNIRKDFEQVYKRIQKFSKMISRR